MQWFKLYSEFASDPKVQEMTEVMQRRLIMLYCLRCHGDLSHLTAREISLGLRISLADLEKTYAVFRAKGFIEDDWSLPKWEARQTPTDPTAATRMKNYRRRRSERNGTVTRNGTPNAPPPAESKNKRGIEEGARAPDVTTNVTDTGPDPPPSEQADVARLAEELTGDRDWAEWVYTMASEGHPPAWIRDVVRKMAARARFSMPYGRGILEDYRVNGGPDRKATPRPPGAPVPATPAPPPRPIERRPVPEGPDGDAVRAAWAGAGEAAGLGEDAARDASRDCPYCGGTGWVRLARRRKPGPDQPIAAARPAPRSSVHCVCPLGEWMRCRTARDLVDRMPDLATVLSGGAPWDLEE